MTPPYPTPLEGELARVGKGVRPRKASLSSWNQFRCLQIIITLDQWPAVREQDWTDASFFSAFLGTSFPKEIENRYCLLQNPLLERAEQFPD